MLNTTRLIKLIKIHNPIESLTHFFFAVITCKKKVIPLHIAIIIEKLKSKYI